MNKQTQANLYLVGIGPGDPELMTLKSIRLIQDCDVLFVPTKQQDKQRSLALEIISKQIDLTGKKIVFLYFPMIKGEKNMWPYFEAAAQDVEEHLKPGQTGTFITVGCSTIYSTGGNLFRALKSNYIKTEFIPGVSSINSTAAACGEALTYSEEKLAILPVAYSLEEVERTISEFDKTVLMKAHSSLDNILEIVRRQNLEEGTYLIERAATEQEKVTQASDIPLGYKAHYMSTLIVRNKRKKDE